MAIKTHLNVSDEQIIKLAGFLQPKITRRDSQKTSRTSENISKVPNSLSKALFLRSVVILILRIAKMLFLAFHFVARQNIATFYNWPNLFWRYFGIKQKRFFFSFAKNVNLFILVDFNFWDKNGFFFMRRKNNSNLTRSFASRF